MWISVNCFWLRLHNKCMIFFDLTIVEYMCDILGLSYITGSDGVSYITGRNGLS